MQVQNVDARETVYHNFEPNRVDFHIQAVFFSDLLTKIKFVHVRLDKLFYRIIVWIMSGQDNSFNSHP